jgi:hypothetical protein
MISINPTSQLVMLFPPVSGCGAKLLLGRLAGKTVSQPPNLLRLQRRCKGGHHSGCIYMLTRREGMQLLVQAGFPLGINVGCPHAGSLLMTACTGTDKPSNALERIITHNSCASVVSGIKCIFSKPPTGQIPGALAK